MFTGIVEETGRIVALTQTPAGVQLTVEAPLVSQGLQIGDSVANNGCCLTATSIEGSRISFDLLAETVRCTNFGELSEGAPVNLERSLPANGRLGGHFVSGHVDCAAKVIGFEPVGADYRLEVELPQAFAHYIAFKGSIAIDGISLTVAEVKEKSFVVWIIPHTLEVTNLHARKAGQRVNLEFDLLAKYLERMIGKFEVGSSK
jgi:riboflavin synthase